VASETVRYEQSGAVGTITLNRPERLNALNAELVEALLERLESLAADESVRAVILTGAGRGFCAGGDVGSLSARDPASVDTDAGPGDSSHLRGLFRAVELLRAMPQVSIAAINGPAAGAGLAFTAACDLRYAARSAIFASAFVVVGSSGDYGGAWTLPRLIGDARAREIYFLAERVGAEEALQMGLVSRVLDDADLLAHCTSVAERVAGFAPLTVAAMKQNFNDAASEPVFASYLDREAERFTRTMATRDAAEAARAFVEKRPPSFERR
jgi:2-(1,2-epoxy-1,2-dihydrophenyl)acetyl-CoA isomerase